MKGHIRKRSEKSYSVVVDIGRDPETGKRKQKWFTVRGTKRDAQYFMAQKIAEIEEGSFADPGTLTVAQFMRRWMEEYAKGSLKLTTYENYKQLVERHIIPGLGKIKLAKLHPEHIQKFYA